MALTERLKLNQAFFSLSWISVQWDSGAKTTGSSNALLATFVLEEEYFKLLLSAR
jgi:hypothetical protein